MSDEDLSFVGYDIVSLSGSTSFESTWRPENTQQTTERHVPENLNP